MYVDPPAHAVVLSVDEKSQIQALDRTQPGLPMKKGRAGTMTYDYKRHGTTTLFAALNVLDGTVIAQNMQRHTTVPDRMSRVVQIPACTTGGVHIQALEKKKLDDEACGEVETAHPGYRGSQDTFYVGTLKGVGRVYQQTWDYLEFCARAGFIQTL